MTHRIVTHPQAVRLKIPVVKTRKPPLPTTQSRLMMKKAATALLISRKIIGTTVSEMDLSSINFKKLNQRSKKTHSVLIN